MTRFLPTLAVAALTAARSVAFLTPRQPAFFQRHALTALSAARGTGKNRIQKVDEADEGSAIPFIDNTNSSFIDCYPDCVAVVDDVHYTIGIPCDHAVALCYFDKEDLLPIELDDPLIDEVFAIAESIVADEFGDDLVLQRTPQTLTLVGELEDDDVNDDFDDDDDDQDEDDVDTDEEDVEVLLSFECNDKEYHLVRLLDPVLIVGKADPERSDVRRLLTVQESTTVMPALENMFLDYHEIGTA